MEQKDFLRLYQENEPKEDTPCQAVLRTPLRIANPDGARGNSSAFRRTQTRLRRVNSPRTFSVRIVDARRVTKGI